MNDFYTRLKNGETREEIITSIVDALNKAEAQHNAELKAAAAEADRKAKEDARKNEILGGIVDGLTAYCNEFLPIADIEETDRDILIKELRSYLDSMTLFFKAPTFHEFLFTKPLHKTAKSDDEVIRDFLNKICS